MGQISLPKVYRVNIIESERGWGSKIDETKYFDNEQESLDFVKSYNDEYNSSGSVPDWYMIAEYCGRVS